MRSIFLCVCAVDSLFSDNLVQHRINIGCFCSFAAGEVQVVSPSLDIHEGFEEMVCVMLMATTDSPTMLANALTVNLSLVLNDGAGL